MLTLHSFARKKVEAPTELNLILSNDEYHWALHNYITMQIDIRLNETFRWKNFAYLSELPALNGLLRREFLRLTLLFRLNDIRLKNWRKSKLRIVSMVDCLKNLHRIHVNNCCCLSNEQFDFVFLTLFSFCVCVCSREMKKKPTSQLFLINSLT